MDNQKDLNQDALIPSTQKPKSNFLIIILILVGLLLSLSFIYFSSQLSISKKQKSFFPTPISNTAPTDETVYTEASQSANWKTYINQSDGFSFRYPPLWRHEINPVNQYVGFFLVGTNPDFFSVDHPGNEILAVGGIHESKCTYKDAKEGCLPKIEPDTRFDFFTIDGRPAVRTFNGKPPVENLVQVIIWINPSGNQIIPIVIFNFDRTKPYFDQILSTFKFLPSTDSTSSPQASSGQADENPEGKFCGGFHAVSCPDGYQCLLDVTYEDAGGKCTNDIIPSQ